MDGSTFDVRRDVVGLFDRHQSAGLIIKYPFEFINHLGVRASSRRGMTVSIFGAHNTHGRAFLPFFMDQ